METRTPSSTTPLPAGRQAARLARQETVPSAERMREILGWKLQQAAAGQRRLA
jgi:hypothetical protein